MTRRRCARLTAGARVLAMDGIGAGTGACPCCPLGRRADAMLKLRECQDGVAVPVLVKPGAGRNGLCGEHDGCLKLAVSAAPEKGKANEAVRELLARELGVSKSQVHVLSGHTSRRKEVLIERVSRDALEAIVP